MMIDYNSNDVVTINVWKELETFLTNNEFKYNMHRGKSTANLVLVSWTERLSVIVFETCRGFPTIKKIDEMDSDVRVTVVYRHPLFFFLFTPGTWKSGSNAGPTEINENRLVKKCRRGTTLYYTQHIYIYALSF